MATTCPRCGASLAAGAQFCAACGQSTAPAPPKAAAPPPVAAVCAKALEMNTSMVLGWKARSGRGRSGRGEAALTGGVQGVMFAQMALAALGKDDNLIPDEMGQEVDPEGFIDATAQDVTETPAVVSPDDTSLMDYEQACMVLNSENKPYGEIETANLSYMYNKMGQLLKNPGSLTDEKVQEYQFKRGAIDSIMAHRKAATQG